MLKSIFKRVLVGVGVGIILSLFAKFGLISNVYAMQVYTGNMINSNQSNRFTIDSVSPSISYDFDALFHDVALGTSGYIRFPISINKVGGSSTSSIVSIRGVTVKIGDLNYICDVGSTSGNNSTYQFSDYSVMCPVNMSGGLHNVYVAFNDLQTNDNGTYRVTIGTGVSYEKVDNISVNVDTSNVTSAIGTQISNDNSNTQQIINNQNSNTNSQIESQKVCNRYSYVGNIPILKDGYYMYSDGRYIESSGWATSDFIHVNSGETYTLIREGISAISNISILFTLDKTIYRTLNINYNESSIEIVPNQDGYVIINIQKQFYNSYQFTGKYCVNGNQAISDNQQEINNSINDVNDTLNDDDVTDATDSSSDFFENFQVNGHGLSNFITMPFRLIQSFTAQTCTPLQFQLPFVHNVVTIPCFRPIIQQHFPTILALFQLITTGLICYRVCINTFSIVKCLQNPTDDRIEVLDL